VAIVADLPSSYRSILDDATGDERGASLEWTPVAYVCHVGDNLRIWAERLMGVARGASTEVSGYDQDLLARARHYDGVALEGARWSLERAVTDWLEAVECSEPTGTVLVHPERGPLTLEEVAVANAHDTVHHGHDLVRILRG
jgi:hypothetical protein